MMIKTIIFDWKRTLYDPDTKLLIDGAKEVLEALAKRDIPLVLIGKGGADMDEALDSLGVRKYFTEVHFVDAKSDELFEKYVPTDHPESTIVVGDRAQGEIAIGKRLGAKAIWVKSGQFSVEPPFADAKPDQTVAEISEILEFI